jgi:hypothetical protein
MTLIELITEIEKQGGRLSDIVCIRHDNCWYPFEVICDDELITIELKEHVDE